MFKGFQSLVFSVSNNTNTEPTLPTCNKILLLDMVKKLQFQ